MNKIDLAYIAGFIDGEGCIGILKRQRKNFSPEYHIYVSVGQKDAQILDWLAKNYSGAIHHVKRDGSYMWNLSYNNAYNFLKQILPYLKYKKPQAQLALSFYEQTDHRGKGMGGRLTQPEINRREELLLKLKSLKREFIESTYYCAGTTTKRKNA